MRASISKRSVADRRSTGERRDHEGQRAKCLFIAISRAAASSRDAFARSVSADGMERGNGTSHRQWPKSTSTSSGLGRRSDERRRSQPKRSTEREPGGMQLLIPGRRDYSVAHDVDRRFAGLGRGLLAAACGVVLMFQMMASALTGSTHLAVNFDAGETFLIAVCGTAMSSERHRTAHVESVNTCCVWAKSVALAPVTPPASERASRMRLG